MRISGSDIVVDTYPGLLEPQEPAGGVLVPSENRDPATSKSLGTVDSRHETPDATSGAKSDAPGRHRQDTVDIQELREHGSEIRLYQQAPRAVARAFDRGGSRNEYRLGSDGRLYAIGSGSTVDVSTVAGNSQKFPAGMGLARWTPSLPANTLAQDYGVAAQSGYDIYRLRPQVLNQQNEQGQAQEEQGYSARQKGTYIDTWA